MQDGNNIDNLPGFEGQSTMSTSPSGGRMPYGIGSLLMMLMGNKMWPMVNPNTPQSSYDALWQREHDMRMMSMARTTVAHLYPFENMGGINENSPFTGFATSMLSQPDGIAARILNPLLGGNPVQAQMSSLANLQGIAASGLGSPYGTTIGELDRARSAFDEVFYRHEKRGINQDRAKELRGGIEKGIKEYGLDISGPEMQDLFNSRNEINPGSAYNKVQGALGTVDEIQRRLAHGGDYRSKEEFTKGLDLSALGKQRGNAEREINNAFEGYSEFRGKEMDNLSGKLKDIDTGESELGPIVEKLTKAIHEGSGRDDLMKVLKDGIKLKGETVEMLKKNISESFDKVGDKLVQKMETTTRPEPLSKVADNMALLNNLKTTNQVTKGVDYSHSLGFDYETLMNARNEMLRNRLATPTKEYKNLDDMTKVFAGGRNADLPALLDAGRGAFGNNISDKELMNRMSDYVGFSDINVMKPEDMHRVEMGLRGLKSVARESNVSMETVMDMHKNIMNYAASNPNTAGLGGIEGGELLKSRLEELNVYGTMGENASKFIRNQGGTQNMAYKNMIGTMSLAQSPMVTTLSAAHTYIKNMVDEKKLDPSVLNKYEGYMRGNEPNKLSLVGFQDFLQKNVPNPEKVFNYSYNNGEAASQAYRDPNGFEMLSDLGSAMDMQEYRRVLFNTAGQAKGNGEGQKNIDRLDEILKSGDLMRLKSDRLLRANKGFQNLTDHIINSGAAQREVLKKNPEMAAKLKAFRDAVDAGKEIDADVSRKMGKMRASTIQRVVQSVVSGDYSENGIVQLLADVGVTDKTEHYGDILKASNTISKLRGSDTVQDVMLNTGGNKKTAENAEEFSKLAEKYGVTGEMIERIARGANSLDADERKANSLDKIISKPSMLGKDAAGETRLKKLSGEMLESGMFNGYKGDFSAGSLKDHFITKAKGTMAEGMANTVDLYRGVDDMYKVYTNKLEANPAMKDVGKAMKALSSGSDHEEGAFKVLDKAITEQGYDKVTNKEGKTTGYKLTENYGKLADAYYGKGKGVRESASKEDVEKTQQELHSKFFENPTVSRLMGHHAAVADYAKEAKDGATKEDTMVNLLKDIIKSLGTLTSGTDKIAPAVNNLSETISGKAH